MIKKTVCPLGAALLPGAVRLLVTALLLAACQSSGDKATPVPTLTYTAVPVSPTALPPTWTPSPVPTTAYTPTPIPTITPRPTDSPTPDFKPGVAVVDGNGVVVTILQEDLNEALTAAYENQPDAVLAAPPQIALPHTGNVMQLDFRFYNEFLGESSHVSTEAQLGVKDGLVSLSESLSQRTVEGALVSDRAIWAALALVQSSINSQIGVTARGYLSGQRLVDVLVYTGYLEVRFVPGGS